MHCIPGIAAEFHDWISQSGKMVVFASAPSLTANYCHIDGAITLTAAGTMNVIYAAEIATATQGALIAAGACGIIWAMQ